MTLPVNFVVVIPARYESSRFPGKLLAQLGGETVLARTYRRVVEVVGQEKVIIGSDHVALAEEAARLDARHVSTSTACMTGTDRVAEVVAAVAPTVDWVVNVQADEPFIDHVGIERLLNECEAIASDVDVINCMAPIASERTFRDPSAPKLVTNQAGLLLYMSRASIPTTKSLGFAWGHRQVGLYAFRPAALESFAKAGEKSRLEELEDIEILRFLELGFAVKMVEVPEPGLAIDTPQDLVEARSLIQRSR